MTKYKVLYVEDDATIAFLTQDSLSPIYDVSHYQDGDSALAAFKNETFDICILDIMVPKLDGFNLARAIRLINTEIPIIFISAKTLKEDRIKGLKIGADDYLVKPFSIEELILKLEVFLRRTQKSNTNAIPVYQIGKYAFDYRNFKLSAESETITLTQRESDLLKYFVENKNTVLKREKILKAVWGDDDYFMGRSLDVFISRLRKIFSKDPDISVENIHGIGFVFKTGIMP